MKLHFVSSGKAVAQEVLSTMTKRYGQCDVAEADCVVSLGGDGTALRALTIAQRDGKPVYALRLEGSLGNLGNIFHAEGLAEHIATARPLRFHPLEASVRTESGTSTVQGINEIVLVRQGRQTSKLRVLIDGRELAPCLTGDGLLVATPVGSSAYNRSAGGAVLDPGARLLAITALLPFQPGTWCNRVLADEAVVMIEVIEPNYRRVKLEAGQQTIDNVRHARITRSTQSLTLLFDRDASLLRLP